LEEKMGRVLLFQWIIAITSLTFVTNGFAEVKVLAFAGSLREDSANKKLVREAARMAKEQGATVTVIDLKDYPMPFFDEDLESTQGMPEMAKAFRRKILESNVVFIASPEYNHSFSGVLKNALDWASRTEEGDRAKGAFKGIKFALMSASPGKGGGAKGLPHLREVLQDVGASLLAMQVSIPNAYTAFDAQGSLIDPKLKADLQEEVREALTAP
jgi:chromate reductase, NAD(P)H dehydrogenase (quinone)